MPACMGVCRRVLHASCMHAAACCTHAPGTTLTPIHHAYRTASHHTTRRDIVPLGKVRSNFNFSLDDKRVLNLDNVVTDDDNIKQVGGLRLWCVGAALWGCS